MSINIDLEFESVVDRFDFDYSDIIKKAIDASIEYVDCPYECEINVLLTDDEHIHQINKETRDIDRPTDVLSFPMVNFDEAGIFDEEKIENEMDNFHPDTGELMLGDIVLSVDKIISQSQDYGHTSIRELAFLVVHSMLHLVGFDHMVDDERIVMEQKQKDIMAKINILR